MVGGLVGAVAVAVLHGAGAERAVDVSFKVPVTADSDFRNAVSWRGDGAIEHGMTFQVSGFSRDGVEVDFAVFETERFAFRTGVLPALFGHSFAERPVLREGDGLELFRIESKDFRQMVILPDREHRCRKERKRSAENFFHSYAFPFLLKIIR